MGLLASFTDKATIGDLIVTENQIITGNASNKAQSVAMSGDATIVASGALTLVATVVQTDQANTYTGTSVQNFGNNHIRNTSKVTIGTNTDPISIFRVVAPAGSSALSPLTQYVVGTIGDKINVEDANFSGLLYDSFVTSTTGGNDRSFKCIGGRITDDGHKNSVWLGPAITATGGHDGSNQGEHGLVIGGIDSSGSGSEFGIHMDITITADPEDATKARCGLFTLKDDDSTGTHDFTRGIEIGSTGTQQCDDGLLIGGVGGWNNAIRITSGNIDIGGGNIINTGTLTLPTSTDTLVGKATTDVFTNKSYDANGTGNVLANIDNGNVLAGSSIPKVIIKSADETINSSSTLQNDDELTIAVSANKRYYFNLYLYFLSDTTPDFKYAFTVPASTTSRRLLGNWNGASAESATGALTTVSTIVSGGTSQQTLMLSAYVITGASAGSITLQWAQDTSDVANTTVKAGSTMVMYEV